MIFLIRPNISRLDSLTDVNYRSCVHKLKIVKFSKFLTQNDIWMTPERDMTPFHLDHHCVGWLHIPIWWKSDENSKSCIHKLIIAILNEYITAKFDEHLRQTLGVLSTS